MPAKHDTLIQNQFGPAAADYVASAVHAEGADLRRIAQVAAAASPAHALDLGCGGGHVAYALAPHAGEVIASDLSPAMTAAVAAEAAGRSLANIRAVTARAEALAFADASFDLLACRFTVHHWRDAGTGLREARRVLRPGGPALFADMIAPDLAAADTHLQAVELLRDPSHGRDYREGEWRTMLEQAGFTISAVTTGRLRMDFADWTARMRTPPDRVTAIRALQVLAGSEVAGHFEIEADGSFTIDTILIEAS
jgi:ubiquinone/menaquinone biosynthesis C-methylase UbiE